MRRLINPARLIPMRKHLRLLAPILISSFLVTLAAASCSPVAFNGSRAFGYIEEQMTFGNRLPGSLASQQTAEFIRDILVENDWTVSFQEFEYGGIQLRNIIAYKNSASPDLILGAHYDTRRMSDNEKSAKDQLLPVPGANDGASGTALLLEISHHLNNSKKNIWLVFFDAEDQGNINSWPWSVGADYFASQKDLTGAQVVIVDMIGDRNLEIFKEMNSDSALTTQIWKVAKEKGFAHVFIDQEKYSMMDDHIPFVNQGIPSTLLIDFDYPYWHTRQDLIDKVSGESLAIVGEVLLGWISHSP